MIVHCSSCAGASQRMKDLPGRNDTGRLLDDFGRRRRRRRICRRFRQKVGEFSGSPAGQYSTTHYSYGRGKLEQGVMIIMESARSVKYLTSLWTCQYSAQSKVRLLYFLRAYVPQILSR